MPNLNTPSSETQPMLERFQHVIGLYQTLNELSQIAIDRIERNAVLEEQQGQYDKDRSIRDQTLIQFFKEWPEAEARFWLGGEQDDTFLSTFKKRYPWFVAGENKQPFSLRMLAY